MRFLSLLMTLLIVAWLVYRQLGDSGPSPAEQATWKQAETKAAMVEPMIQQQFEQQADRLQKIEEGQATSEAP